MYLPSYNRENASVSFIILWKRKCLIFYYVFAVVDQEYNLKNDTVISVDWKKIIYLHLVVPLDLQLIKVANK